MNGRSIRDYVRKHFGVVGRMALAFEDSKVPRRKGLIMGPHPHLSGTSYQEYQKWHGTLASQIVARGHFHDIGRPRFWKMTLGRREVTRSTNS